MVGGCGCGMCVHVYSHHVEGVSSIQVLKVDSFNFPSGNLDWK